MDDNVLEKNLLVCTAKKKNHENAVMLLVNVNAHKMNHRL